MVFRFFIKRSSFEEQSARNVVEDKLGRWRRRRKAFQKDMSIPVVVNVGRVRRRWGSKGKGRYKEVPFSIKIKKRFVSLLSLIAIFHIL